MVDLITWHSMLVELHGGMLTLAAVCIVATIVARTHLRMRRTSERYGILWPIDSFMGKLARYTEPTAYIAGIGGVIGLLVSAIIGFYIWPISFLTASTLGLNKVMFSIFATALWIVFVVVRSKYGENLWKNGSMAAVYSCLGIFGFLFMVIAGSFGGHMALKGSILDPIYSLLGITPETFGVTGLNYMIAVVSVTLALIIIPLAIIVLIQRRAKLKETSKT